MSGDVQQLYQRMTELNDSDTPITDTRPLNRIGGGSVGQTLMMHALRQEGYGPDVVGKTAQQTYYPEESCIVIELSTIDDNE